MRLRIALAWLAAASCAGLFVWATMIGPRWTVEDSNQSPALAGFAVGWAITGAVLVSMRPRNAVGWLLLLIAAFQSLGIWGNAYGGYGVGVADPQWPGARWVALLTSMIYLPSLLLPSTVLLALYPQGRLPARWWRWPVGAVSVSLLLLTIGASLSQDAPTTLPRAARRLRFPTSLGRPLWTWVSRSPC